MTSSSAWSSSRSWPVAIGITSSTFFGPPTNPRNQETPKKKKKKNQSNKKRQRKKNANQRRSGEWGSRRKERENENRRRRMERRGREIGNMRRRREKKGIWDERREVYATWLLKKKKLGLGFVDCEIWYSKKRRRRECDFGGEREEKMVATGETIQYSLELLGQG